MTDPPASLRKAKLVRVDVEEGKTGLFYATSRDMDGLLVAEASLDALGQSISRAIVDLYAARGTQVNTLMVESGEIGQWVWVIIPADVQFAAPSKP